MDKLVLSWSGGKDSAFALYKLQQGKTFEVAGLLTTITKDYDRVSMHGVRTRLVEQQAEAIGLPLIKVFIPAKCTNDIYAAVMTEEMNRLKAQNIVTMAFGDIFLQDVREYREKNLAQVGMKGIFPLWGLDSKKLAREFVDLGFKSVVSCIDTRKIDAKFLGRVIDHAFLDDLPANVDPCAENGEFHSFAFDGPIFSREIRYTLGEIVPRDDFRFIDLVPAR